MTSVALIDLKPNRNDNPGVVPPWLERPLLPFEPVGDVHILPIEPVMTAFRCDELQLPNQA